MTNRPEATRSDDENQERDTFTLRILGWFLIAIATLTSLGLFQADKTIDRILTVAAAAALFAVGLGMVLWARHTRRSI